ncbi:MAG: hypothetical protein ACLQVG_25855 [Terriglobia bacterium]
MPRNWTTKFRRSLAPYVLMLLQLHLLGIAMLHRHGETAPVSHGLGVSGGEATAPATSDCNIPCPACQIVQTSSVQPASTAQVLPPANSVLMIRRMVPSNHCADLPVMSYGRAPPPI